VIIEVTSKYDYYYILYSFAVIQQDTKHLEVFECKGFILSTEFANGIGDSDTRLSRFVKNGVSLIKSNSKSKFKSEIVIKFDVDGEKLLISSSDGRSTLEILFSNVSNFLLIQCTYLFMCSY